MANDKMYPEYRRDFAVSGEIVIIEPKEKGERS